MKRLKYLLFAFLLLGIINVNALEKSIINYSYGVDGRVSTKSISAKMNESDETNSIILSTITGIYITNGSNYLHIDTVGMPVDTKVIDDINNDGVKDIVYAVNNVGDFYNLVAVSGKDGNIIWNTKISVEKYDYYAGFIDKNKNIYKIKIINNNIAVIHDYVVEMFNLKTGKSIFKYEEKDNIWDVEGILDINSDSKSDIVISNQLGEVKALDGSNGKLLWKSKVIKDFTVRENKNVIGTVTRNVWQVVFSNKTLYAIGDDGTLYKLNYKTGKVEKTLNVFAIEEDALNNYFNSNRYGSSYIPPIGKNSDYFKNFEIFMMDNNKALITAFVNKGEQNIGIFREYAFTSKDILPSDGRGGTLYGGSPLLILVDLNKMEEIKSITLNEMELSNVEPVEITSEGTIAIPTYIKDGKLIVNIYNSSNLEKIKNYEMYIGNNYSVSDIKAIYTSIYNNNVLIEAKENFSMLVDTKLTNIVKNNNTYASPSVLISNGDELVLSYKLNGRIERIVKYSSISKREIAWEYVVTNDFVNDGITSISITHDFNGDGVKDLVGLVNKRDNENNVVASYILVLDMKNGTVLDFRTKILNTYYENGKRIDVYLRGNNIYAINDITGDRRIDFVIDNNIANGANLNLVGLVNEYVEVNTTARPIKVGDVNGDGFSDIVTIEESVAYLHLSRKTYNSIVYYKTNIRYTYDKSLLNFEQAVLISDINNDGIDDIVFNAKNSSGKQYYKILSGRDLSLISNIKEDGITSMYNSFALLKMDIDGDGYNDLYELQNWGSVYEFISGKTGETLLRLNLSGYDEGYYDKGMEEPVTGIVPFMLTDKDYSVALGNDVNKDGHNELLVLKEIYYPKQEVILQLYDVYNKNNSPIKEIKVNTSNNTQNWVYAYDSIGIPEPGYEVIITKLITKISNTDNLYIVKSSSGNNLVFDLENEKIISGFTKTVLNATDIGNNTIFCTTTSGEPIIINYENPFEIKNIKNGDKYSSPLKVEWTYEDYGGMNAVKIYDNGNYIKTVYGNSAELLLREGKHVIIFESADRWGKVLSGSIEVNIEKTNITKIIYSFISVILIALTLAISIGPKIRRNMTIRRLSNE